MHPARRQPLAFVLGREKDYAHPHFVIGYKQGTDESDDGPTTIHAEVEESCRFVSTRTYSDASDGENN